jgi:hypothetical protein
MAFMLLLISRYGLSAFGSKEVAEDIVMSFPQLPFGLGQHVSHLNLYWQVDYRWLGQNDRTPSFNEERA